MEGLLPLVYRVIVQSRKGGEGPAVGNLFSDESLAAASTYRRLDTCDSGAYSPRPAAADASSLMLATVLSPRRLPIVNARESVHVHGIGI
ncbi:hypothetical protein BRADI_1g66923v3 [Brachypodium distachyon]|uniref:Uncharacterized protein n=1 Tax=Brachypodium distachyon TaxID=15368 RepID=A0A2K2DTT2_BRADI|nr:hypothetical protein BRADI_1g66923v3 [Brachypodium distachyon]